MLETEEVDDDHFTPVANTSLSNIFRKPKEETENESLKYSPPLPKQAQSQENTQSKRAVENIFSCIFDAYLWLDNIYTLKGKLGCAVVKLTTDGNNTTHIILYDSKKTTVSTATATKELDVYVKEKEFISYYDQFKKYWCLYGSETDIKKVIEVLTPLNVKIKDIKELKTTIPGHHKNEMADVEFKNNNSESTELAHSKFETADLKTNIKSNKNIESDTDSSINRKTKASILNRMANMGQSVLPPCAVSIQQSDSSDTNESDNHIVAIRPKPVKNRKNSTEKNIFEHQRKSDSNKKAVAPINRIQHSIETKAPLGIGDQLITVQNCSIIPTTSGNDLNFFITEQRVNNSELRINMARMTDKVDHILDKISDFSNKDRNEETANFNTEIFQKLLQEYESKIRNYEDLLKKRDGMAHTSESNDGTLLNELTFLRNKVEELDKSIKQRDYEISLLNNEIESLKQNSNTETLKQSEDEHHKKILKLEQELLTKSEILETLTIQNHQLLSKCTDNQISDKIKVIMNDTFRAVAANFENNESYSGDTVKNVIATVIKKVTKEALNEIKT